MSAIAVVRNAQDLLAEAGLHGAFLVRDLDTGAETCVRQRRWRPSLSWWMTRHCAWSPVGRGKPPCRKAQLR
ncbi:hypothetical protein GA0070561_6044 [Micromonospora saelicesensis]|uniref:Uncharacterized protein n=1 Tax=Micromonospora saelicesensis TaxID=285676 RepID=A0A1C4ZZ73_9ACTN|nr:hypothetical protein GA0070561_6044 [Micromonospora saelicesensis]